MSKEAVKSQGSENFKQLLRSLGLNIFIGEQLRIENSHFGSENVVFRSQIGGDGDGRSVLASLTTRPGNQFDFDLTIRHQMGAVAIELTETFCSGISSGGNYIISQPKISPDVQYFDASGFRVSTESVISDQLHFDIMSARRFIADGSYFGSSTDLILEFRQRIMGINEMMCAQ